MAAGRLGLPRAHERFGVGRREAVVPSDPIDEQRVLVLRTPPAIVHDQRPPGRRQLIGDDGDVVLRYAPLRPLIRDDIAGQIILGEVGNLDAGAVALEEAAYDFDAAMIDARIAAAEARGVDQLLKIDAERPIGVSPPG